MGGKGGRWVGKDARWVGKVVEVKHSGSSEMVTNSNVVGSAK